MRNICFLLACVSLGIGACTPEYPDFPDKEQTPLEPVIDSVSMQKTQFTQGEECHIFIHFTDGDGNIGYNEGDSMSIFISDPRFPLLIERWVPPLYPLDATPNPITGTLKVVIDRMILKDPKAIQEEFQFEVQLRDRTPKRSWLVKSPMITIKP